MGEKNKTKRYAQIVPWTSSELFVWIEWEEHSWPVDQTELSRQACLLLP